MNVDLHIDKLDDMSEYPKKLNYIGSLKLLQKKAISIVGTRKPTQYTKNMTATIASKFQEANVAIVSGVAMGVDAIAHEHGGTNNAIAVVANGLDIRYPAINRNLIQQIENNGLVLSSYNEGQKATKYSFVLRNEIVVALGDILIITQADKNSGSITSAKFAKAMGKQIYTIPHRYEESQGTKELIQNGDAKVIYDIDEFLISLGYNTKQNKTNDRLLKYCKKIQDYEKCVKKFGNKIFEYELMGKIKVENSKIIVL